MINHEIPHQSFAETATQIAYYFDITDQVPLMSDTNKKYTPVQNACYNAPCPVNDGVTTVIISPTADNMADIYNGFIYAEMELAFQNTGTTVINGTYSYTWIGFKDSMDAIEKYVIQANGIDIYTQNNAIEESYVMNCAATEAVKTSDVYSKASHKDVWNNLYGAKCGTWVDWANPPAKSVIKLKIDLRHFLPLSNIKYLPAFAGKIEIKLYFSVKGLVVGLPDPTLDLDPFDTATLRYGPISNEFVQIGDIITMPVKATTLNLTSNAVNVIVGTTSTDIVKATTLSVETRTISVKDSFIITKCESIFNCFGLHQPVYNSLVQRYSQQALTFPTQILQVNTMSSRLSNANSSATVTINPRFVDSIFLLFPLKVNHKTIYKNPGFHSFQLSCGGYGSIPAVAYGTVNEPRLIEMCSNAVNLNGDSFGLSTDVLLSLAHATTAAKTVGFRSLDATNFFIGIPTETDNTFQQGQTSNTPITYELTVNQDPASIYATNVTSSPVFCMLLDATFNIMINQNGMPPMVSIGPSDITSPVEA
jgi:hypothetical protein